MILNNDLWQEAANRGALQQELGHGSPESCQVLGDVFGFVVQFLLFAMVLSTLLLKWWMEKPRRRFKIFLLDSSKQIFGAGAIHCMNMVCAMIFAGDADHGDQCAWYWTNIMIDTTVGVLITYGLLKLTELAFGYDSGHYGKNAATGINWEDDPDYWKWGKQILVWGVIVALMKLMVVVVMWAFSSFWIRVSALATHWIEDLQVRLIFVMIVTPTVMNMFQFIVTDSFLKFKKAEGPTDDPNAGNKA